MRIPPLFESVAQAADRSDRADAGRRRCIAEIARFALASDDLDVLLGRAAETVRAALSAARAEIWERQGDGGRLVLRAEAGARGGPGAGAPERSSALAARLRSPSRRWARGLHVPLAASSGSYGVLSVYDPRRRRLRRDEVELLQALGDVVACVIERRRALDDAVRRERALACLAEANRCFAETTGEDAYAEVVAHLAGLGASYLADVAVAIASDGAGATRGCVADGQGGVRRIEGASDERPSALLAERGAHLVVEVPLVARGLPLGRFALGARDGSGALGPASQAAAEALAARASAALECARLASERRDEERRKDEFLSVLAHELRNPLAGLAHNVAVLRAPSADAAARERALESVARQTLFLERLVDELVDVSQVARGEVELRRVPLELGELLRGTVETALPVLRSRAQQLSYSPPDGPLWVEGDAARLEQLVASLLDDSSRYVQSGGRMHVTLARDGELARIGVACARDDGALDRAPDAPGAFDLFAALDGHALHPPRGLGIGLHLVRRLAELHGGSAIARRSGPEGAARTVELVVRLPLIEGLPQRADLAPLLAAPLRVVVVDDHEDASNGLAELLRSWGHDVRTAFDGPSGLALARALRPDLVILDIGLPGLDGYALARALRASGDAARTRIVALTGFGADEDRRKAHEAGFDEHFTKPIGARALRELVRRVLEARDAGEEEVRPTH